MPTKDHIEWSYVVLLVGIVVMVAAALHLLPTRVAFDLRRFVDWFCDMVRNPPMISKMREVR